MSASKRRTTPAISSMSEPEIRRLLTEARKTWIHCQKERKPFFLTQSMSNGMSLEEFVFRFISGLLFKRNQKNKSKSLKNRSLKKSYSS